MEKVYILLSCEIGTENQMLSKLQELDLVTNVMITYGDYDIVVEAESDSESKLDELITTKIRKLEKIRSTITLRVTA